jgi:hypothetical protein
MRYLLSAVFFYVLSVQGATTTTPPVTWFNHTDAVYARATFKADNPAEHIVYLGSMKAPADCLAACVARGESCRAFTYHGVDTEPAGHQSFSSLCYGITDLSSFQNHPFENATSGQLGWPTPSPTPPPTPGPCTGDEGCSFNGVCSAGSCSCDAAWTGPQCSQMALKRAVRGAGLHSVDNGHNTSTWGGSVLRGEDGTYHMYAAEMVRHCGIHAWTENSRIVHATSSTATGNYTRQDEVFGVFSHEPNAVRDPATGDWVLFFTAHLPPSAPPAPHPPICNCTDGSTLPCQRSGNEGATYASWSKGPAGPWSTPLQIIDMGGSQSDTNLAPVGTVVG